MKWRLITALLVLVAATLLWRLTPSRLELAARAIPAAPPATTQTLPRVQAPETAPPSQPSQPDRGRQSIPRYNDGGRDTTESETGAESVSTESSPERAIASRPAPGLVLENMRTVFRQYSSRFGGNPVGTNPEITASLKGNNPGKAEFLADEDGLRVNDRGELVDNWGTPFFFHQLSRNEMEIHSAGPDRRMWTADDLVIE